MVGRPVLPPGLRGLLWPLYLFALAWMLTPFYAGSLALVLPMSAAEVERLFDIAVAAIGPLAIWTGRRGGPLLVPEANVLYDMLGGSGHRMLGEALVRQVVMAAALGALSGCGLAALSGGIEVEGREIVHFTALGIGVAAPFVALAVLYSTAGPLVVVDRTVATAGWIALVANHFLLPVGTTTPIPAAVSLVLVTFALFRCVDVPLPALWARCQTMSSLRSGLAVFDLQETLAQLRAVGDGSRISRRGPGLRAWIPFSLWRVARSVSCQPSMALVRSAITVVTIAAAFVVLPGVNISLLLGAGLLFSAGIDLAAPLTSLVDKASLSDVGRARSTLLATGHVVVITAAVLGFAAAAWGAANVAGRAPPAGSWGVVALGVGLGVCLQGRNGSPNLVRMLETIPAQAVGQALAVRGAAGLLLTLVTVIGVVQQRSGEPIVPTLVWVIAVTAAAITMVRPLTVRR